MPVPRSAHRHTIRLLAAAASGSAGGWCRQGREKGPRVAWQSLCSQMSSKGIVINWAHCNASLVLRRIQVGRASVIAYNEEGKTAQEFRNEVGSHRRQLALVHRVC